MSPIIYGGQSLYEVMNLWSLGDFWMWYYNYRYRLYAEREEINKARREAEDG